MNGSFNREEDAARAAVRAWASAFGTGQTRSLASALADDSDQVFACLSSLVALAWSRDALLVSRRRAMPVVT